MGWVWRSNSNSSSSYSHDSQFNNSSSSGDIISTRKVVKSNCKTEEVEPGKFIRKCEKTEELLRNCAGKPVEVLQSNKEYTEEEITDEVVKGRSGSSIRSSDSADLGRELDGIVEGLCHLFDMATEEMRSGFYDMFGKSLPVFDAESPSSSSKRRGIPVEEDGQQEAYLKSKDTESGDADLSALAKDV